MEGLFLAIAMISLPLLLVLSDLSHLVERVASSLKTRLADCRQFIILFATMPLTWSSMEWQAIH